MAQDVDNRAVIAKVAEILRTARQVFFVTGAGVSADSGLLTYRGISGLYNSGATEDGMPIEEAVSGETFARNPAITWKYLARIEAACRKASYNRAHELIAAMERTFDRVCVLTQNIDGFHTAAGSTNVIDIHGDLHDIHCTDCDWRTVVTDYSRFTVLPPRCPACNSIVRPGVVLFGEQLSHEKLERIGDEWREHFDIVFSVGTTSVFPYIAQPVQYANHHGIPTVEINPDRTAVTWFTDHKITAGAAETLAALREEYQ